MIISDRHRFVFVHIPKCAGTSVRQPLTPFNEWRFAGPPWQLENEELGLLDYGHIPLITLRDHFAYDFNKVRDYWSFSVVRDPHSRFASSVSQRLKMYGGGAIQDQPTDKIRAEIQGSIDFLQRQPGHQHQLPAEYIHFQKQVDYVYLNGVQILDSLYLVDEVKTLLQDVSTRTGMDLLEREGRSDSRQANRSVVYRNQVVRRLVGASRPFARMVYHAFPKSTQQRLESIIYVPRDTRLKPLFCSEYVNAFVNDYYREDLELYNDVREARLKKRAVG
ncbi:sulfotransferase family 2 domain-containing protein [Thioalkalivibrio sp. ALJ2]|uniref:sulfotransferase family 2 domain-containing protein n=1 Tax=Thioalkalivibrio sp. ALJ2 TaxID=1261622 RepID=UPI00036CB502|nr:sulfotransferase family 2 domain-containing protein [Thioalkalivibrio sp. ALJ2]